MPNLVISWTGSVACAAFGTSYTGCSQTETADSTSTKAPGAGATSGNQSTTTVADNCWICWMLRHDAGESVTAGTNSFLVNEEASYGAHFLDTNAAQTPAGSKTLNASWATSTPYAGAMLSFAPSGTIARDATIDGQVSGTSITLAISPAASSTGLLISAFHQDSGASAWTSVYNGTDMGSPDVEQSNTSIQKIWIMINPNPPVSGSGKNFFMFMPQ